MGAIGFLTVFSDEKPEPFHTIKREELFMEKRKRVNINKDWCKGCGVCVAFCPKEVLVLDHREKAQWAHQEKCISCGLCELRCPDLAIELEDMEP